VLAIHRREESRCKVASLAEDALIVRAYDPRWPGEFDGLRQRALAVLGELALAIEHVGSTAVPGLAGKPVVDLDVVVSSSEAATVALDRLSTIGYEREGRGGVVKTIDGLTAMHWPPGERRHHLYIVIAGSRTHLERVAFRDYLRTHPEQIQRYADLKLHAMQDAGDNWERYAQLKQEFVRRMLREALPTCEHHTSPFGRSA
jgi:GrpB-like predicted nucleotidyltransferase (UPF0157 family)